MGPRNSKNASGKDKEKVAKNVSSTQKKKHKQLGRSVSHVLKPKRPMSELMPESIFEHQGTYPSDTIKKKVSTIE